MIPLLMTGCANMFLLTSAFFSVRDKHARLPFGHDNSECVLQNTSDLFFWPFMASQ